MTLSDLYAASGLSLGEIARRMGSDTPQVCGIKGGYRGASVSRLVKLARVLNCSQSDVLAAYLAGRRKYRLTRAGNGR